MKTYALTFEQIHNKHDTGSTRIRIYNLMHHWPELQLYRYGVKPDVLLLQKVYELGDYHFIRHLDCLKILDICDPDWFQFEMDVRATVDAVAAVTCPTDAIAEFIRQLTDKPVVVIPDRFVIGDLPSPRVIKHPPYNFVWFGYAHNAEVLQPSIISLEDSYKLDEFGQSLVSQTTPYQLTIISNQDPQVWRYATNPEAFAKKYHYIKYDNATILAELNKYDAAVLPKGFRPEDRFKSNNKTILANLAGLPVISNPEEFEAIKDYAVRNRIARQAQQAARADYDARQSVAQMQDLIKQLS